jgi:hypothetical protein
LFDGFVHPGLLIGAALAAVPLLIHLLNRQRFKPLPWAAMRFVEAAYRKTRRRARLENLLLLLLRMGAIALLALAIARPYVGPRSALSGLTESRRDLALILDASYSTGWRDGARTVFEREVERARELLSTLDGARGDRARLVVAARVPRLLSWRSPEEAIDLLETLGTPSDEALDLAYALGEVREYAEELARGEGAQSLEVHLLSDLQRSTFMPDLRAALAGGAAPAASGAESTPRLFEELDRLKELGLRLRVHDLGVADPFPANLSVSELRAQSRVLGPDQPVDLAVRIDNSGISGRNGVRVVLEVDGERRPQRLVDVPGRGFVHVVFSETFRERGPHRVRALLESDALSVDDSRAAIVVVPPAVRVLLVNGAPSNDLARDEVGYLSAALEPARADDASLSQNAPFEVRTVDSVRLAENDLDLGAVDVIWLANVENLLPRAVERLEARIAAGGALIVSLGDRADPLTYGTRLFRADGSGLLPAELVSRSLIPREERYWRIQDFEQGHPALAFFADERWKPLLTEMPFYGFFETRPLGDARVLARFDDAARSPALIERNFDRGRVFLWTSTIDADWTRMPESPRTLVPFLHELVRNAGTAQESDPNLGVGGSYAGTVEIFPRKLALLSPDGARRAIVGEPQQLGPGVWRLPSVNSTERAGMYEIEIEGRAGLPFAVTLDARESDLARMNAGELSALHPLLEDAGTPGGTRHNEDPQAEQKGELWRLIAAAALACIVLDTLWAAWIGRERSVRR